MVDKTTPEFYRQEAERLVRVSTTLVETATRMKVLEVAAAYRRLATLIEKKTE